MGFNKKSDAGPYEGMTGQQQKISQVIHQQADETSMPIHFESDDVSTPIHFESDDVSLPIIPRSIEIPLINFNNLGHNTNYAKDAINIHEMQNISSVNLFQALGILPDLSIQKYDDENIDGLDIARDAALDKHTFEFANISLYQFVQSNTVKWKIDRLSLGQSLTTIYSRYTDCAPLFPVVPIPMATKQIIDYASTPDTNSFASNPIMIPVLKPYYSSADSTAKIDSAETPPLNGSKLSLDGSTKNNIYWSTAYLNNSFNARALISYDKMAYQGDSGGVSGSYEIGTWEMKHPGYKEDDRNLRGLILSYNGVSANSRLIIALIVNAYSESPSIYPYYIAMRSGDTLDITIGNGSDRPVILGLGLYEIPDCTAGTNTAQHDTLKTWVSSISGPDVKTYTDIVGSTMLYNLSTPLTNNNITNALNLNVLDESATPYISRFTMEGTFKYIYGLLVGTIRYDTTFAAYMGDPSDFDYDSIGFSLKKDQSIRNLTIHPLANTTSQIEITFGCKYKIIDYTSSSDYYWRADTILSIGSIANNGYESEKEIAFIAQRSDYSGKIYDPAILTDYLSTTFHSALSTSAQEYTYRQLQSATNSKNVTDSTEMSRSVKAEFGILINNSDSDIGYDIIIQGEKYIESVSINILFHFNTAFALTEVALTTIESSSIKENYYYGILNKDTLKHYSPINIVSDYSKLASESQLKPESINVLSASDNEIIAVIKDENNTVYISFKYAKHIPSNVFLPKAQQNSYIYESFIISENKIDSSYPLYRSESELAFGYLGDTALEKQISIIENDEYIAIRNPNTVPAEFFANSLLTFASSNMLSNSYISISDISTFANGTIKLPLIYPCYKWGIPTIDHVSKGTALTTFTNDDANVMYYNISGIMMQDYQNHVYNVNNESVYNRFGSIIISTLPSIDQNIKTYAVLPEKLSSVIGVEYDSLIDYIGTNRYVLNESKYIYYNNNLYPASKIGLVVSELKPLLDVYGEIYTLGNIICITNDNGTYIYTIDKYSGIKLLKTITGTLLDMPVSIGEDYLCLCNNGIYTLQRDMIYRFDTEKTSGKIKAVSGYGYLTVVSEPELSPSYLYTDTGDKISLDTTPASYIYIEGGQDHTLFQISNQLSITKLDSTSSMTELLNSIIYNDNIPSNNLQLLSNTQYSIASNKINTAVTNAYYTTNTAGTIYIETEPLHIRNQEGEESFDINYLLLEYVGNASVTATISRGVTTIFTATETLDGSTDETQSNITEIYLGSIRTDGVKIKLTITPIANTFKLLNMKAVGDYTVNYILT